MLLWHVFDKKKVLNRLKLMRRDIINGEVVELKIMHDITKLVFDQIRINCIKKTRIPDIL